LLQEDKESEDKDEGPAEFIAYWKPNITISLVDDFTQYLLCQTLFQFDLYFIKDVACLFLVPFHML
jgi:hypothetical protein